MNLEFAFTSLEILPEGLMIYAPGCLFNCDKVFLPKFSGKLHISSESDKFPTIRVVAQSIREVGQKEYLLLQEYKVVTEFDNK